MTHTHRHRHTDRHTHIHTHTTQTNTSTNELTIRPLSFADTTPRTPADSDHTHTGSVVSAQESCICALLAPHHPHSLWACTSTFSIARCDTQ